MAVTPTQANPGAAHLSDGQKAVLYFLTDRATEDTAPGEEMRTRRSLREISMGTRKDKRTVERCIKRLEELGMLEVTRICNRGSFSEGHLTNTYTIIDLIEEPADQS